MSLTNETVKKLEDVLDEIMSAEGTWKSKKEQLDADLTGLAKMQLEEVVAWYDDD